MIREQVKNPAVSNMLIQRIREKSEDLPLPPKKFIRPKSSGLKYLNKVASQMQRRVREDKENKEVVTKKADDDYLTLEKNFESTLKSQQAALKEEQKLYFN